MGNGKLESGPAIIWSFSKLERFDIRCDDVDDLWSWDTDVGGVDSLVRSTVELSTVELDGECNDIMPGG